MARSAIRAELFLQEDSSVPRNPLMAGAFHPTDAIKLWGPRGNPRRGSANRSLESPRQQATLRSSLDDVGTQLFRPTTPRTRPRVGPSRGWPPPAHARRAPRRGITFSRPLLRSMDRQAPTAWRMLLPLRRR